MLLSAPGTWALSNDIYSQLVTTPDFSTFAALVHLTPGIELLAKNESTSWTAFVPTNEVG
jgi:hypothetical protein